MVGISRSFSNRWGVAAAVLVGVFLGMQFIRPALQTSAATETINAPEPVKRLLKNSCYDCHSNQIRLAWFDRIVPAYWLVVDDVKSGRKHLNFSDFDRMPVGQQRGILFESLNQMQFGAMPPKAYTLLHSESRVTPEQVAVLKEYLSASGAGPANDAQRETRPPSPPAPADVSEAPNGIAFMPEYKDWTAISSTERFDNHTLRIVFGNSVAVAAVQANQTKPWPNGTVFAKAAWEPAVDATANVLAGNFVQVEFMIKDAKKYAATKGWGFARWKGTDLKPYGTGASFTEECVGCHTPMRDNDFVFTTPAGRNAPVPASLPFNPFQSKVITSSFSRHDGTMATLYGNDLAARSARGSSQPGYSVGSVLSMVTWSQRADDHWFGARIPGRIKSVEVVTVESGPDGRPSRSYQQFTGSPLSRAVPALGSVDSRIDYILGQRASVMP